MNNESEQRVRGGSQTRPAGRGEKKNQGKSGMNADFLQRGLSVTMATRIRCDVITPNG